MLVDDAIDIASTLLHLDIASTPLTSPGVLMLRRVLSSMRGCLSRFTQTKRSDGTLNLEAICLTLSLTPFVM